MVIPMYHALAVTLFFLGLLLGASPPNAVVIPSGSFQQGSERAPDEQPTRTVKLSAFSIDRHEVSVAEFQAFCTLAYSERRFWSKAGWQSGFSRVWGQGDEGADARVPPDCAHGPSRAGRGDAHPVVAVSWYEAEAYCSWRGGALPTEAQWERAACGGQPGPYPWGADADRQAQWTTRIHPTQTMTVATALVTEDPNPSHTGIKHAAGNVWEWTADWYHREAYAVGPAQDPTGPPTGRWKTLRGGSFANLPSYASCTHREPAAPVQRRLTAGFRCAYPAP
jgi:formylglycine-generating enzyme required for sulfatase activity